MEQKVKTKEFDAVALMRDIRDEITKETQGMSFQELKTFISGELEKEKKLNTQKK